MKEENTKRSSRLTEGVKKFKEEDFDLQESFYRKLGRDQNPHTLFIGCSDSRVIPSVITKSMPGELFIVRNIANLVPIYDLESSTYTATASVIEYAVNMLNVERIIVCGHSNCGGCKALYTPKKLENLPSTKKWLELAEPVKEKVEAKLLKENSRRNKSLYTEQLNVIEQMNHLLTYPYVKERVDKGELEISGWYFVIKEGKMYRYTIDEDNFVLIE